MKKKINLQTILIGVVAILLVIILVVQLSGGDKEQTRMEQLQAEETKVEEVTSVEPVASTDDRGNEISGMQLEVVSWLKQGFGEGADVVYIDEDKTFGVMINDESIITSGTFVRKFVNPLTEYASEINTTYGEGYTFYIADSTGLETVILILIQDGQVIMDNFSQ